jgi:hypothetical protein
MSSDWFGDVLLTASNVQKILHKKCLSKKSNIYKITEIVNVLDSDGVNFSKLSDDMCKVRLVPMCMRSKA